MTESVRWSDHRSVDAIALVTLLGVGLAAPLLVGAVSGAITIPHNDDPAIRRVALGLYASGRLELNGWTTMTLVGQILWIQPFLWLTGGGAWAFAASTAVLTGAGILAGYGLVRRILSPARAALAVLAVLLFPGFMVNTTTVMTDVPSWAAATVCLTLGAVALDRSGSAHWRWLVASLAVGLFGFAIRDFAAAAPTAVLVSAAASRHGPWRNYVVAGAAVAAVAVAIFLWTHQLPGQQVGQPREVTARTLNKLPQAWATLALLMAPATALAILSGRRRWRPLDLLIGGGVGVFVFAPSLTALAATGEWPRVLVGNLLEPSGHLGRAALAGSRPLLYRGQTWELLNAAAMVAAIVLLAVLAGIVGERVRAAVANRGQPVALAHSALARLGSTHGLLLGFALAYGTAILVWGLWANTFDRYLWPLAMPMAALLLSTREPSGARRAIDWLAPVVLVVAFAATSTVLLLNAAAFDRARWRMGELAVARGYEPGTVDAGFEWVSMHATGMATPFVTAPPGESRFGAWWPSFRLCAMVSGSPLDLPGYELLDDRRDAYRLLLFVGPRVPLYLYRVDRPGCP